jgi:hypothetical protein
VASITGRIRGMKFMRSDGRVVRPSLAIVDDFQSERSAWSPTQCVSRLKTINGTILKLAGPGVAITALCPCTVIRKGDAADVLLDREKCPQWKGRRCKKLNVFPKRMDLWREYSVRRSDSLRAGGRGEEATAFYREHWDAMHEGADVAWPQRFEPEDADALQTSMNLFFEDRSSFMAECQNAPIDEERSDADLKPADLVGRFSGRPKDVVPVWADKLTAFIDVQASLLYFAVCAWRSADFTGSVISYGSHPEQSGRRYFTLADAQRTLALALPGAGVEAQIRKGLDELTALILGREWVREDGAAMKVDRLLIDSGYEMDTVFEACRSSPYAATVMPSRGQAIGAKNKPMHEWQAGAGDRRGNHWHVGSQLGNKRAIRWARIDTNHWKSHVVERLRQPVGSPGR